MKAWVLHDIGDIRYETVKDPNTESKTAATAPQVLVKVKAAGICGSDIPRIYRTGAYSYPLIPGHEFSGVVADTGQRVGIFPLIPCGQCVPCRKGQYEMCRKYSYLGSRQDGGFAEYAAVPAKNLICLPDSVTFEEGAMLEPMAVAVHAMRRVMPKSQDMARNTVTVWGLGTIGLLLVMFLKEAGINRILVVGNKEFQRQKALELGVEADCYCDSRVQDGASWLMEHTDGQGTDVFFECVGKNETYELAVDCTAPAGRICLVGNPGSDMGLKKQVYWKILRNQLTVTGTWNSSFSFTHDEVDDWHYVMERLSRKRIAPAKLISHRFSLEELEKGLVIMRDKTEEYGKVMVVLQ